MKSFDVNVFHESQFVYWEDCRIAKSCFYSGIVFWKSPQKTRTTVLFAEQERLGVLGKVH